MKKNENEQHEPAGFSSSDCVIIIEDRPGEAITTPLDPRLKKTLEAEREKIRRWRDGGVITPRNNDGSKE